MYLTDKNGNYVSGLMNIVSKEITSPCILFLLTLFLVLFTTLFVSCSLKDDRDVCCEKTEIIIRYVKRTDNMNVYRDYIKRSEHFIFNSDSLLIGYSDVTGKPEELLLTPSYVNGKYILLVLGNRSEKTSLSYEIGKTHLSEMLLTMNTPLSNNNYTNGDRLYWGLVPFEINTSGVSSHYYCDMSNIHCRLKIVVKWKNHLPSYPGKYKMLLSEVPSSYKLTYHSRVPKILLNPFVNSSNEDNQSSKTNIVYSFPQILPNNVQTYVLENPISSAELYGEFITFRYDDMSLPSLEILKNGKHIMRKINLTKFFKSMNWIPSRIAEQYFRIVVVIDPDNDAITVYAKSGIGIKNWEDGGVIFGGGI